MLFNSYEFIFIFLIPVFLISGFLSVKQRVWFLVISSVVFYAKWNLLHLGILIFSIAANFFIANVMDKSEDGVKKRVLALGVVLNLIPLGYFKYSYFLHLSSKEHVLPLAISFYTFQQIAFLVDLYRGRVKVEGVREYLFFVLFFPQLVAGPIVHYNQIVPQIKSLSWGKFKESDFAGGVMLFSIGLFKKVVLADNIAEVANHSFGLINSGLSFVDAWVGVVAYSFEIYFDFSGYSDMAVGLGLLFGIRLPINFDSPYKSRNIIEFWRRWNITLSFFLRDYLYIPLGGNRVKIYRQVFNLLVTMTIGGIWHGAGWGFVLWGFLHGTALGVCHLWKKRLNRYFGVILTFFVVTLLWVLFRSDSVGDALKYYDALFGLDTFLRSGFKIEEYVLVVFCCFVVWLLPNSFEFSGYKEGKIKVDAWHAFVAGVMFFLSLKMMAESASKAFIYFNF